MSDSVVAPGAELTYVVEVQDIGSEDIPLVPGGNNENCVTGASAPADPSKCVTVSAEFPKGLKPVRGSVSGTSPEIRGKCSSTSVSTLVCGLPDNLESFHRRTGNFAWVTFTVKASKEAAGSLTSAFEVSGGGAASASTVDPTEVTAAAPEFGVDGFDAIAARANGNPLTQAGGHPSSQTTVLAFNGRTEEPLYTHGLDFPVEPLRNAVVDLPPGFSGNPSVASRCTAAELGGNGRILDVRPTCPAESQVGTVTLKFAYGGPTGAPAVEPPVPLFNMVPPPGVAARFGFNYASAMVVLDAQVRQRPDGRWGISVTGAHASEALALSGVEVEFWGVPAALEHGDQRHCPGEGEGGGSAFVYCPSSLPEQAFLRMPTSCTGPGQGLPWSVHADSWWNPGSVEAGGAPNLADPAWKSLSLESHEPPGYPFARLPSLYPEAYAGPTGWGSPVGTEGCAEVPFEPTVKLEPTSGAGDSPSGISFDLQMPQQGLTEPGAVSESDVKSVRMTMPKGVTVNPSGINGGLVCSSAQIGLKSGVGQSPALFSGAPQTCPDPSKIGHATVESPLLTEEGSQAQRQLHGGVYLAAQHDNPFGSLFALYLVIEDPQSGTIMKLPGELKVDPETGQIETIFDNNPELPFSNLHVFLSGGPRGAVRNPYSCGTYHTKITVTPWSGGAPAVFDEPYEINSGPGGSCPSGRFEPEVQAGTANPIAGSFSPFNFRLYREDGMQEIGGLKVRLPEGLLAKLAGIPYCPDSALASVSTAEMTGRNEEAIPSCPAASRVGRAAVTSGPGPTPVYASSGAVYLAGPYKGAPLSLAVVTPAVTGPFDLGSVVVRNPIYVDPETAEVTTVSDPLPLILHGVMLDLREIRISLDRPEFTENPTSCEPMKIDTTVSAPSGATASASNHFQVTGCEALPFKPKLALRLSGDKKRGGFPALRATAVAGASNEANISKAVVSLPHSEFIAQGHLNHICTRVQYAADGGGGAGCPKGSVYGHAVAYTPLLDKPLEGPVYLRSNGGERVLPDLVASLGGQIHVDLVGYIDSSKKTGGIRTTFASVPDAFVSKFVLNMPGGAKGLLQNSTEICAGTHKAIVNLVAHNGKAENLRPAVKAAGCKSAKKRKKGVHGGRRG